MVTHLVKHYLEVQAKQKGFHLIRTEHFLSPNQARNSVAQVDTKYVVFVDNDLLVQRAGWKISQCADETGAWVVGPLYFEGSQKTKLSTWRGDIICARSKVNERFTLGTFYTVSDYQQ